MDIAAMSILKNLGQVQQQVSVAMTRKVLDMAEQNGSLVNKLMGKMAGGTPAAQTNLTYLGANVNLYV